MAKISEATPKAQSWKPGCPPPQGIRYESLRQRGVDSVSVKFEERLSRWGDVRRDGVIFAILIGALAVKPEWSIAAIVVVLLACHGAYLWHLQSARLTREIIINSSDISVTSHIAGRDENERETQEFKFSDLYRIEIGQNGARTKALSISTYSGDVADVGAGLDEDALVWIRNLLVMEVAGLTQRPLHGVDRRYSRSKQLLDINPLVLDEDLARQLVDHFTTDGPGAIEELAAFLEKKDAHGVQRVAHQMARTSASVAARHLSVLFQQMETCGAQREFERTHVILAEIRRKYAEVVHELTDRGSSSLVELAFETLDEEFHNSLRSSQLSEPSIDRVRSTPTSLIEARVLVVDDSAVCREIAVDFLGDIVTTVVCAADGIAGLELLNTSTFDLVLIDCEMHGLNGYQCTRRWRSKELLLSLPAIPIIATTSNTMKGDRARCIEAGMTDYLAKPFSPTALHEKVEYWIHQYRSAPVVPEAIAPTPASAA